MTAPAKNDGPCRLGPPLYNYDGTRSKVCVEPEKVTFKEVRASKPQDRYVIDSKNFNNDLYGASLTRHRVIVVKNNKGEWDSVRVTEPVMKGKIEGQLYLERNSRKMGLVTIELSDGAQYLVPKNQAKNFNVVTPQLTNLLKAGALERHLDSQGVYYIPRKEAGERFLAAHPTFRKVAPGKADDGWWD